MSIDATYRCALVRRERICPAVLKFFDALVELLTVRRTTLARVQGAARYDETAINCRWLTPTGLFRGQTALAGVGRWRSRHMRLGGLT